MSVKLSAVDLKCKEPSSPAHRIGRALGLVSHVRCDQITKVIAKLTGHNPQPDLLKEVMKMTSEEMPCTPLNIPERNTLLASEIGKRIQTACFEQGLKALHVAHIFMARGHPSFRLAISSDPSLLNLDKASDSLWLMIPTAKQFNNFIKKYGSYLNDLTNFLALAKPYDLYAKPIVTTTTSTHDTELGGGTVSQEKTVVTTTPSPFDLTNARTELSRKDQLNLIAAALALFKSAYSLTPDDAIAKNPVSREMVRLVYGDIKLLYTFVTDSFYSLVKRRSRSRVVDMERGVELFEAYETACAEVSVFFAITASYNIISSTPKLRPVPRSLTEKFLQILANAKESGLEVIDCEERDPSTIDHDTLENVLAASEIATQVSEDTVGSPGGSLDTPRTQATGGGSKNNRLASNGSGVNWEDDSLLELRTGAYARQEGSGVQGVAGGNDSGPSTSNVTENLDNESEDIKDLLTAAGAGAIMVAASENSVSAARRFHLLKDDVLGKGGFGTVFKAWDKCEGMYAAVKEITVDTNRTNIHELFGEFRTATTVSHENIVKTLMFSLKDETGSIFMEWLPAGSLHQVLSQTKVPFSERLVRRYVRDALCGLDYLHKRGIVHRDIKLSNMLLSVGGKVKLTDFGSSKVLAMIDSSMKTETIVGTVPYMAPEAVRGTYSASGDIWAIGCSIVEMLTATHPWAERGEKDQIAMIFHIGSLQSPNHMPGYGDPSLVSEELRSFLEMCFVFDYHSRPSAEKLLEHPWLQMDE